MTAKVYYKGELRTEAIHIRSGEKIITDAPVDNHGKGEAFSPTDLLCTSLACCMISIMGIAGNTHSIEVRDITAEVVKTMASDPRRVSKIDITIYMPNISYSDKEKKILTNAALSCPVSKSLHPDIEQNLEIKWYEFA
jgi:putative redox protein